MNVHLEDIIDVTNGKNLYKLLCPKCDSKLDVGCFGESIERHILRCCTCKIAWKLKKSQLLYKTCKMNSKEMKRFF